MVKVKAIRVEGFAQRSPETFAASEGAGTVTPSSVDGADFTGTEALTSGVGASPPGTSGSCYASVIKKNKQVYHQDFGQITERYMDGVVCSCFFRRRETSSNLGKKLSKRWLKITKKRRVKTHKKEGVVYPVSIL